VNFLYNDIVHADTHNKIQ